MNIIQPIRKQLKLIVAFFTINFLTSLVAPYGAYALTSGPTAPEATSFEPIDTTDMVNPLTGDFTYNMPLLEVPGPSGGYPLSLSYHAGIMPNEDASWVGLGWTLNPGALTRNVNGFADDLEDMSNINRQFWEGGVKKEYNVGISIGIPGIPVSVGGGLTFSQDTYQGRGVGFFTSAGMKMGNSPIRIGFQSGVDGYGNSYGGMNAGFSVGSNNANSLNIGASVGLSTNFETVSGYTSGSVSYDYSNTDKTSKNFGRSISQSLTGASLSTASTRPSLSVGGGSTSVANSKAGHVSTKNSEFAVDIPVWYGVNVSLGYKYSRYWINEIENTTVYGALSYPETSKSWDWYNDNAYDTYSSLDPTIQGGIVDHPNPDEVLGGSFPNYDNYSVNAQGIGGDIRPYAFRQHLVRRTDRKLKNDGEDDYWQYDVVNHELGVNNSPVEFRFINDFSNQYQYDAPGFANGLAEDQLDYDFTGDVITGEDGQSGILNNHLAGSKHIEYLTNNHIKNNDPKLGEVGFIETTSTGFIRGSSDNKVGAFVITNPSGVKYHFALPAYAYDELQYSENTEMEGENFNTLSKPDSYAYTWYLTAITGPDYVDRGTNGELDEEDWGYWVEFNYGKWATNYQWRSPDLGYHKDLDLNFQNYSRGKKDLYYLDAIRTKTHTALFIKEIREDGKGLADNGENPTYDPFGFFHLEDGNFDLGTVQNMFPTSTLRLDKVILVENEQLNTSIDDLKTTSDEYQHVFTYESQIFDDMEYVSYVHRGHNVLDIHDWSNVSDIYQEKVLRQIDFDHNYNLAQGTTNSFSNTNLYQKYPDLGESPKSGKLTLNSIEFRGKGGADLIPPTTFQYANNAPYDKDNYDLWKMYKSDVDKDMIDKNVDVARAVSQDNTTDAMAWSLNKIKNSLGSEVIIEYEPDTYSKSVLNNNYAYTVKAIDWGNNNTDNFKLKLWEDINSQSLAQNSTMKIKLGMQLYTDWCENCLGNMQFYIYDKEVAIEEIVNGEIYFTDPILADLLFPEEENAWTFVVAGNISFENIDKKGGGVRVKQVTIDDLLGNTYSTNYEYNFDDISSGVTSFEPSSLSNYRVLNEYFGFNSNNNLPYNAHFIGLQEDTYKKSLYNSFEKILINSREVPAPGVMYEKVKVTQQVKHGENNPIQSPGHTVYEFEVFDEGIVGIKYEPEEEEINPDPYLGDGIFPFDKKITKTVKLKDYTNRIGSLKKITAYDTYGNKLSETLNHYLHDQINVDKNADAQTKFQANIAQYEPALGQYNNQGVIEETYADARFIRQNYEIDFEIKDFWLPVTGYAYHHIGVITKRETFPVIQTGQTTTNYKTGISTTTQNLAFDFYSGQAVKTLTTDGYGNKYVVETTPAYKKYPGMELAINDGANMLTQTAATTTYKVNNAFEDAQTDNNKIGLVGSTVQTWTGDGTGVLGASAKDQEGIFRKKATYSWIGNNQELQEDGHYPYGNFVAFDAWNEGDPSSDQWQKNGEITLYDAYSHALEAIDVNGNYAATRMDANQEKVIATVANAPYDAFTYSGFENVFDGKVSEVPAVNPKGQVSSEYAHTGTQSFSLKPGGTARYITTNSQAFENKPYVISYWTKVTGAQPDPYYSVDNEPDQILKNGFDINKSVVINDDTWYLHEAIFTPPSDFNTIRIGVKATDDTWVDDFRFHPLDAAMVSYVYNEWGELSHVLDANNLFTEYRYDAMGRLQETYSESFQYGVKRVSEYDYKYALLCEEPVEDLFSAEMINHGTEEDPDLEVLVSDGQAPYTYTWYVITTNFLDPNLGDPEFAETTNYFNSLFDVDPICSAFTVKCKVTDANNEAINLIEDFNEGGLKFDSPLGASFQKGVGEEDHELTVRASALNGVPPYDITATVFIGKVQQAQFTQQIAEGEQYEWVSYYNNESEYEEFSVSVSITDQQNCQISTRVIIITDSEPGPIDPECSEQGTEVAFVCEKCQDVPEFNTGYVIPVLADGDCGTYQDPLLRYKNNNACPPNPDPDFICQIPDSE